MDGHVLDAGLEKQDVITAADVLDGSDVAEVLEDARDGAQYRRGRLLTVVRLEGNGGAEDDVLGTELVNIRM